MFSALLSCFYSVNVGASTRKTFFDRARNFQLEQSLPRQNFSATRRLTLFELPQGI
jgi:hypothetical protein